MNVDNPRWLSAGEYYGSAALSAASVKVVDLGLVSVRDAAIYGKTRPLIPFAEGRLIKSISYVPGGTPELITDGYTLFFVTPNSAVQQGYAKVGGETFDTYGLNANNSQTAFFYNGTAAGQILDCGPLVAVTDTFGYNTIPGTWQPDTTYCLDDFILDGNGHLQKVDTLGNGVSGSTEPVWDNSGGQTTDGTVIWFDFGLPPEGEVHAIAEVIEGVSPMPPYPASLEFVDQPQNVAAGETMEPVTVIVKDQNGDPWNPRIDPDLGVDLDIRIFGVGTLSGTSPRRALQETSIATFDDLSITEQGTGYILRVKPHQVQLDPIFSTPFNVT